MNVRITNGFRKQLLVLLLVVEFAHLVQCSQRNLVEDLKTIFKPNMEQLMPLGEAFVFNDNLTSDCTTALFRTGRALQTGKMWALKMLSSSGLIPENLFMGQTQAHGSFEQCIKRPINFEGDETFEQENQYCKIRVTFESNTTMYQNLANEIHRTSGLNVQAVPHTIKGIFTGMVISLCLPKDCNQDDLTFALDAISDAYGINGELSSCQTAESKPLEVEQIFVMFLLAFIFSMSVIGLIIESRQIIFKKTFPGRFLRCFAISTNWSSLLECGNLESRTSFLNGLKLLLCLWISAGHLIIFPSPEFTNNPGAFFNDVSRSLWFQLFSNINLAVVGFFFISPAKYIALCFVRRYVKLVIPALIVLLTTLLYPLFSNTPSPREGFYYNNVAKCSEEWYLLLCLSNNYIDILHEQCLTHLWYIATDLKIYPIVVALSVLYRKHPNYSKVISTVLVIVTSVFVGVETYIEGAAGVVARADLEGKRYTAAGMALDIYTRPYTQMAAYIMGMLCATIIEKYENQQSKLTSFAKSLFWTLSVLVFLVQAIFITYSSIQVFSPAGIGMSIYSGVSRPLHAMIYMWVITACTLRLAGPISRVLSHPIMYVLGKLSYGVYLVHFPLASLIYANLKNASLQYNFVILTQGVFGTLTQSFILAVILFVFVEKPLANIDKLLVNRSKRTNEINLSAATDVAPQQQERIDNSDLPTTAPRRQSSQPVVSKM